MLRVFQSCIDHGSGRNGGDIQLSRFGNGKGVKLRRSGHWRRDAEGDRRRRSDIGHRQGWRLVL